ncbi:egg cell-secreted protein 1.1-like [Prunus yedoensis var. nudiflora]|uniref:Egg cell-secreted protein 1.1-like n=1 Tax=Prunus yedoensis var. nudiflora TaxID=2094558 RepID=A0A314XSK5_PRUYE|nr:egg cell-secreted protein 1.1-like [Prunus yedoensis var. nudiflora]
MAASNLFLLTILALSTTMPLFIATTSACFLNYNLIGSNVNLEARLNLDEESSNCWDSLFQLQACSSEGMAVAKPFEPLRICVALPCLAR